MKKIPSFRTDGQCGFLFSRGKLLQETDGERVFVFLAIAGADRGDNHEDNPENEDHRQDEEADEDKTKDAGHGGVDGVGDLEIQHFFAGAIEERAFRALDQPKDERSDDVAEGEDEAGKAEQLHDHSKGIVVGRRRRDSGRLVRWRGDGRRRVFHEVQLAVLEMLSMGKDPSGRMSLEFAGRVKGRGSPGRGSLPRDFNPR